MKRGRRASAAGAAFPALRGLRIPIISTLRSLAGLALVPTSMAAVLSVVRVMGGLAGSSEVSRAGWFLGGFAVYGGVHCLGILQLRRFYVFAHELTHAIAVWLGGGKVFKIVVGADSGHVDLSRMSAFIALAPYWVPLYALGVVAGYRVLLWWGSPVYSREVFLFLMGVCLSFHLLHTLRSLWVARQSDLEHAGFTLSISLIAILNAAVLLAALKCLFPVSVQLAGSMRWIGFVTFEFWRAVGDLFRRGVAAI